MSPEEKNKYENRVGEMEGTALSGTPVCFAPPDKKRQQKLVQAMKKCVLPRFPPNSFFRCFTITYCKAIELDMVYNETVVIFFVHQMDHLQNARYFYSGRDEVDQTSAQMCSQV
jgi:hypothetical protein